MMLKFKYSKEKTLMILGVLCLAMSPSAPAAGQAGARDVVTQFANWYSLASSIKNSENFSIYADVQLRYAANFEASSYQFRVGGDFKVGRAFTVMPVGYVYILNYAYGKQPVSSINNEHRIYQQFTFHHKASVFNLHHRLRTEERFIERHPTDANGETVYEGYTNKQFRVRYRLTFMLPLTRQVDRASQSIDPKSFYLTGYDEFFFSWGQYVTYHEVDQNRVFFGVGYQFSNHFTIQSGFLYQMLIKSNGAQQENNMGVGTWITYNFDLTKQ